ncbi:helix-turn-helix transcriptional regulator [Mesorhizobium sp. LHD-90]|uniref:helix-turn-helix transcriptional regulator n=1 Tax=Mesorhizobium sp. LHD-90 TaxID=3071414 RepID=UPI0027E02520|nr:helix-turn-helix transcriptional regulator [Mesorhizobium sp. LHD-90]MDQ6437213.1 helix-turn-helix transcriptional regulator [Mesorhizobium sp. LHD-90]
MLDRDEIRRTELGRFLKSRRAARSPADLGRISAGRRRTPGLRREEVAEAAGISAAWYIRLEQGRDVRASLHALDRIGKALRLDRAEQAYLLELARPDLDWKNRVRSHEAPSPVMLAMLAGLMPHPAYILNRYWQVKALNRAAAILFGDLDNEEKWGANLVHRLFLDEGLQERFAEWPVLARSIVAQFRLSGAAMANDPVMEVLVAQICAASPHFRRLWESAELSETPVWRKALTHPVAGRLNFDFAGLRPPGPDGHFTLAIHTASDAATRARLEALLEKTSHGAQGAREPG